MRGLPFFRWPGVLSLAASLSLGCFTEVGNPEDPEVKVETEFRIDYRSRPQPKASAAAPRPAWPPIAIEHFRLDIYDAEYFKGGKKRYLKDGAGKDWNDKYGNFVDLTGKDSLGGLRAYDTAWQLFFFTVNAKKATAIAPDSIDIDSFSVNGWMRGQVNRPGYSLPFLYEIPEMTRMYLVFRPSTLADQRTEEGYRLETAFRALWFQNGVPWDSLDVVRDRRGRPFILISRTVNATIHGKMKEGFRRAFGVDSAQIDGEEPVPGF